MFAPKMWAKPRYLSVGWISYGPDTKSKIMQSLKINFSRSFNEMESEGNHDTKHRIM